MIRRFLKWLRTSPPPPPICGYCGERVRIRWPYYDVGYRVFFRFWIDGSNGVELKPVCTWCRYHWSEIQHSKPGTYKRAW